MARLARGARARPGRRALRGARRGRGGDRQDAPARRVRARRPRARRARAVRPLRGGADRRLTSRSSRRSSPSWTGRRSPPVSGRPEAGAPARRTPTRRETARASSMPWPSGWRSSREIRPLVLVLDDLHWAEPATLLLLRRLATRPQRSALLLVGTARDTEVGAAHAVTATIAEIRRDRPVVRIALQGLDATAVAAVVEEVTGTRPDRAAARALRARTAGNPFFARELAHHAGQTASLPQSVLEVVGARVARLAEVTQRLLELAAVAGSDVDAELLLAGSGETDDAVLDAIDEALRAQLLRELPEGRLAFVHDLVRDALTRSLSSPRRARLHGRVAERARRARAARAGALARAARPPCPCRRHRGCGAGGRLRTRGGAAGDGAARVGGRGRAARARGGPRAEGGGAARAPGRGARRARGRAPARRRGLRRPRCLRGGGAARTRRATTRSARARGARNRRSRSDGRVRRRAVDRAPR